MQKRNMDILWDLQKPGSKLDFKTDSEEAFLWCEDEIKKSKYKIEYLSRDLHQSDMAAENYETAFEKIFLKQGLKIHFVRLRRI